MTTSASELTRIGIVAGREKPAELMANCIYSLLTAVGRWVEVVGSETDLQRYDALIFTSFAVRQKLESRAAIPTIVYDGDLFYPELISSIPSGRFLSAAGPDQRFNLGGSSFELWKCVPRLDPRRGDLVSVDEHGIPLAFRADHSLLYGLPIFLTPDLQRIEVFWHLMEAAEQDLAALLERSSFLYVNPWPKEYQAAVSISMDADEMVQTNSHSLEAISKTQIPCTLFCCADQLDLLKAREEKIEVAAHGDVHKPFVAERDNLRRVERMRRMFEAAGFRPPGFSPPHLLYTSSVAPLYEQFEYLRLGYMEREFLFFPQLEAKGVRLPVSYYPDHLLKYVSRDEFTQMTDRYLDWSRQAGTLSVQCFHPWIYGDVVQPYLKSRRNDIWYPSLAGVARWWKRRETVIEAVRHGLTPTSAIDPSVVVERQDFRTRVLQFRPACTNSGSDRGATVRTAKTTDSHRSSSMVVYNGLGSIKRRVSLHLLPSPRLFRFFAGRRARALDWRNLYVANKNGFHAAFYGELGLTVGRENNGAESLKIPLLAANEVLILRRHEKLFRRRLRKWLLPLWSFRARHVHS